ncbi:MAG: F0F1 ATP synthase subunit delta [Gomphosphaeria aponina SAG 52.96 = DSM 107014]|uniref:ATP synthase subunit delta n=1 Tax=Gomphosphaeria aponina SAG 52.96 = DSM 107014 TaxID=1521640 RepID=A0A941GRP2_9CHRO|nr:F0F1 ATP synthase subunit delta [Gomphosphaeria aponina SAG 52.96 = DSM 107014]
MSGSALIAQVAEPYAEALMSLAQSNNVTNELGEEVRSLLGLLASSSEFKFFLLSPLVKPEDKKAVIRQILGEGTNHSFLNFLLLLVDRRRIMFLEGIGEKYLEILRKLNNTVLAEVTSAVEMSEEQKQSVSEKIKQLTGAQGVELTTRVDEDLLGGVIIKVGSQVFDTSLRGQLRRIGISLMSA